MNTLRVSCCLVFFCWTTLFSQRAWAQDVPCAPVPPPQEEVLVPTGPDVPSPIVTVKVEAPACAQPGKNVEYHIWVKNCSPAPAYSVVIHNAIPGHARFVQASPQPHKTEPDLQWNLGTLAGHGCQEILLVLAPTGNEDITNCTRVQYEHGVCVTTRSAGAVVPGKTTPTPKETTPKEPPKSGKGKLSISVSGLSEHKVSDPASYKITVTNTGTTVEKKVGIDVTLPATLTFVSAKNGGIHQANVIAWPIGTLEPNATHTVEFTVRARAVGKLCFVTKAYADSGIETTKDTCTTFGAAGLKLQLFDTEDPIPVNSTAHYLIFVQNQGNLTVNNLHLQAQIPSGMELVSASSSAQGVEHKVNGKTISFDPVADLVTGAGVSFEVYAKALTPGDQRFKIQLTADQLKEGGPVLEEESTTVFAEDGPGRAPAVRGLPRSRQRLVRLIPIDTQAGPVGPARPDDEDSESED